MNTKYVLTVGLRDKDSKKHILLSGITMIPAMRAAQEIITRHVEGFTMYPSKGGYVHENGKVITEKSLLIELLFTDDSTVKAIASDFCKEFNQESVAYQKIEMSDCQFLAIEKETVSQLATA